MAKENRMQARKRRHVRVRRKVHGSASRPRLNVYRSLHHIYAQVVDDDNGRTLVAASTLDAKLHEEIASMGKQEQAHRVGVLVAERARAEGIEQVVFDRGGYPYHGRIKALADGSREGGLVF
jgi:large subunit ribosomal protein L18